MRNNPLFKEFADALSEARVAVKVAKNAGSEDVGNVVGSSNYNLRPEVSEILKKVKQSVEEDIARYVVDSPTPPEALEEAPPEEVQHDDNSIAQARFSNFLVGKLQSAIHKPIEAHNIVNQEQLATLSSSEKYLYLTIAKEIEGIESISFTKKLSRILYSVGEKRIEEASILAKNLKKDDPHNNTSSFILSQILYFKACRNNSQCLPEARDEAKKACTYVESFDEKRLLRYRYHCIATERHFSPERTVDIMRSYYMTNPESLTGKDGIAANHFYNLRCWIILSTIPTKMWQSFEIESLKEITEKTIGGALIYLYYLRPSIVAEIKSDNELFKDKFSETEELIAKFFQNYTNLKNIIDTQFDTTFALKDSDEYLWTTPHRCMQYLLALAPAPSADEILMHCSLNAHSCEKDAYPEENMAKIGLESTDYWRSWAIALTPFEENRRAELIPLQNLSETSSLFKIYDDLLKKLEKLEKNTIKNEDWENLSQFMPLYAFENLLEIGHGGPNTQLLRTKKDAPFLPYYRKWRKKTLPMSMPSELIKQHAAEGAFINFKEVQTFFEGIYRVFSSSQYSLEKHIEDAKSAYNATHNIRSRKPIGKHVVSLWWLYFLILPMAGITFLIIASNNDPVGAIKILTTIIGGTIIFLAIILIVLPNRKKR